MSRRINRTWYAWGAIAFACAMLSTAHAATDVADMVGRAVPATVAVTAYLPEEDPKAGSENHPNQNSGLPPSLGGSPTFSSTQASPGLAELGRRKRAGPVFGTGFVVAPDGLILASAKTVRGASSVDVRFNDGDQLSAKIVGLDDDTDIALLRVARRQLPALKFSTRPVRPGQLVVAIGMLGDEQRTVTSGIVSSTDARVGNVKAPLIATDARSALGFGGGPLLNAAGQVVGVHYAMLFRSGEWAGVSFAVAADAVKAALKRIHPRR